MGDPRATHLAGLGVCEAGADDAAFLLAESEGALDLRPPGEHGRPGIRAVLPPDAGGGRRDPLVRAFGPRVGTIVDATAGLGGDAYRLARAGYDVVAVERHPVVHALLADGWRRACAGDEVPAEIAARLQIRFGEASEALAASTGQGLGVFVDPMYPPPRRASARPRRALQVLRALLADDADAAEIVAQARECAARVVVKRPHHASPLMPDVSHTIESKLVRLDVYVHPERLLEAGS